MVFLVKEDLVSTDKEGSAQGILFGGEFRVGFRNAIQTVFFPAFVDFQISFDGHIDEGCRDDSLVHSHFMQESGGGGAETLRGVEQGDNGSFTGIFAHGFPLPQVKNQGQGQGKEGSQHMQVVFEKAPCPFCGRWFMDESFGPGHGNGELFTGEQRLGHGGNDSVVFLHLGALAPCGAGTARIGGFLYHRSPIGEVKDHTGCFNGKSPVAPDGVEIEFVKFPEESHLARGAVGEGVGVGARGDLLVAVADIYDHSVVLIFGEPGFGVAVTQHLPDLEIHLKTCSHAVVVTRGECAVDAPFNGVPFGHHGDHFSDLQIAASFHRDPGIVREDPFLPGSR